MRYSIRIATSYQGNGAWLDDYLKILRANYGAEFTEQLAKHGRAELRSIDEQGNEAVSVYELHQTGIQ